MTLEQCALVCVVLSFIAMVFSWITMATGNWKFYIPTVLFVFAHFAVLGYTLLTL